jgi:hypothetical protein
MLFEHSLETTDRAVVIENVEVLIAIADQRIEVQRVSMFDREFRRSLRPPSAIRGGRGAEIEGEDAYA